MLKKIPGLKNRLFPVTYHGCASDSKSRGVSILIRNLTPWQEKDKWSDTEGRALFVKGTLGGSMVTLVNLYLPNTNQITFLEPVLTKLGEFAEGAVILGGDMNFIMDPTLDSSKTTSQLSYTALKRLKKSFYAFHLVDVWRILHPNQRDYTFYSHPHDSYTRIDLIMMPQSLLSRVTAASIGSITFSDHAPVMVDIDLLTPTTKQWMWKINDSLIQMPEVVAEVAKELRQFFAENTNSEIASTMV